MSDEKPMGQVIQIVTRCRTPLRQEHNPFGNQELGSSGFWG